MKKIQKFILVFITLFYFTAIKSIYALEQDMDFGLKQNIEPNKEWKINFNQLINAESINSDNIYIEDDTGTNVKCTLKVLGNSVIVKSCVDYERGKTYSLYIKDKIKSTENKIIKKPVKMRFKIKDDKKSKLVIKNNEVCIKNKDEINDIIDYCIDNNMEFISINLKNCNDKSIDCKKVMSEKISEIRECHIDPEVITNYEANTTIINLKLIYPYYKNNTYRTLFEMNNNMCEAMLNKHTLKTNELGKISFKVPPKTNIKFSVEDPKILKVDDNGNVIPLSEGETRVLIEIKSTSNREFNTEDEFESWDYKWINIPVAVVSKNANNINKLEDIWDVIYKNLGQEDIPVYITNRNLSRMAIEKEISKIDNKIKLTVGSNYAVSFSLDNSMTHITLYNYYKQLKNEEIKNVYDSVENKATKILDSIIKPGMTDLEKEKAIHDYIVLNTAYDYDNYLNNTLTVESSTPYAVIVKGIGICQGYAEATNYLLNRAGIESCVVYGSARNGEVEGGHAWNIVKIDGKYYQLDVTWDDPAPDEKGRVTYDYFNLTDEEMAENHTWDRKRYTKKCTTKFEKDENNFR